MRPSSRVAVRAAARSSGAISNVWSAVAAFIAAHKKPAPPPAITVATAIATRTNFPLYQQGLGTVQALYTVTVTARVDGQIQKIAFTEGGEKFAGPPMTTAATLTGKVNTPIALNLWVEDPKGRGQEEGAGGRGRGGAASIATVSLHKYRGPGTVTFDKVRLPVPTQGAHLSATATFSEPGEYLLRVQANDESGEGGGGFQCCWTNAYVKATVTP